MLRQHPSHFGRFWGYFAADRVVRVGSAHGYDETKQRLLALNDAGDVRVSFTGPGEFHMYATAHARSSRGTPIIPHLRARFVEDRETGRIDIEGKVGIDGGARIILGAFAVFLLVVTVVTAIQHRSQDAVAKMILGDGAFLVLILFCYALGRSDGALIDRRLAEAVGG
jgi:hypothetical protein